MELKIRCQCGVKYALEVTPETAATPRQFVCQYCGVDSSAMVNQIIQQQFNIAAAPTADAAPSASQRPSPPVETRSPAPAAPVPHAASSPPPAKAPTARLKVHAQVHGPQATPAADPGISAPQGKPCNKHPGQFSVEECLVCHKPLCPACMSLFGYVCSAYCQAQAEKLHIDVPVFAGQKAVVEARHWKKVRLLSAAGVVLLLGFLGAYTWYYFVGSRPRVQYSVRFPGSEDENVFAKLLDNDHALLKRGNQLFRYDLRTDKAVWTVTLVDQEQIDKAAKETLAEQKARMAEWKVRRAKLKAAGKLEDDDGPEVPEKPRSEAEELRGVSQFVQRELVSRVQLHAEGRNIWVVTPAKAVQYDWETGKPQKEVTTPLGLRRVVSGPDKSLLLVSEANTGNALTRIDIESGEFKTAQLGGLAQLEGGGVTNRTVKVASSANLSASAKAAPIKAPPARRGSVTNTIARVGTVKPMLARAAAPTHNSDPDSMDGPSMSDEGSESPYVERSGNSMIFAGENVAQFEVKLLEKKLVQYKTIKDKPKVSELDKGVNAANAVAAMSEVMNEITAELGGGMRTEDESRYRVTIKRLLASGAPDWSGEVVGPPALFALKSVDVLTAGKAICVLDKANKKLWESKLAFPVGSEMLVDPSWMDHERAQRSPAVEREQTLYFFDQGVLTAFELASGNVRWRLTTVGISAIHFDEAGAMYVSTSSAGAESLKYTQQVDLSKRVVPVIMKVDPANGKILWKVQKTGSDIFLTGKYLYTIESVPAGGMRLYRLKPGDGTPIWEHYEKRATSNCDFRQNSIQLVYGDELKVLRFLSL